MKNKSLLLLVIFFVAVLVFAAVLYPKLSESYMNESIGGTQEIHTTEQQQTSADDFASTEGITDPKETEAVILADDFTVYDMNMNQIQLSDFFGKPIVINFWASWCRPCTSELPAFDKVYREYGDDVTFLMVNLTDGFQETVDGVRAFLANNSYAFPVYFDTEYSAAMTYGVYSIPQTVFIDAGGALYDIRIGALSENVLMQYIVKLLNE